MISNGANDLLGKSAMQYIGKTLGRLLIPFDGCKPSQLAPGISNSVDKNTSHNALRRLTQKNILTKIEHGVYQFEEEAFEDWVKYRE